MLDVAIDAREFDAHVAVLCVHVYGFAWKGAALCAISTRAESCGLSKDQRHQCVGILRLSEQSEQSTRPGLFHLHRTGVDAEVNCGQGLLLEIAGGRLGVRQRTCGGEEANFGMARASQAIQAPTISTIASTAPTS